jgi:hypothetical protein
MGFWDTVTALIPGGVDDLIVNTVRSLVSAGPGGSDNPGAVAAGLGGGIMPDNNGTSTAGEGIIPGRQWWDITESSAPEVSVGPVSNIPGTGSEYPGCKITLPVSQRSRYYAPPGYVVVRPRDASGREGPPVAMLKRVAITCGLWKASTKPPISAKDWKSLRRAAAVTRKLDTVVKTANRVTGKADLRRVRKSSGK